MQAHEIFNLLLELIGEGESRAILRWESYWYDAAATGRHDVPDDLRRETLNLKLAVTDDELTVLRLRFPDAPFTQDDLELELPPCGRQPTALRFSPKAVRQLPATGIRVSATEIDFTGEPKIEDLLLVARIAARFPQLTVHSEGIDSIEQKAPEAIASALRRHAFRGIILGRRPTAGFRLLDTWGLLESFLPEVTAGRGLTQNRFHAHDIFEHLLRAADGALDLNEPVRWSALLHDVGKVPTRVEMPDGESTFHNHEMYSARMVVPIMKRLAVPVGVGQKVKFLVRNHMFHYTDEWSDKAVRRFVKKVPLDELQDLISLRLADRKGSGKKTAFPKALQKLMGHIDELIAKEQEFKIKDLAIDGHVLMELGMPASRAMGDMLKFIFEEVKSGRAENTRDALIALVEARRSAAGASV